MDVCAFDYGEKGISTKCHAILASGQQKIILTHFASIEHLQKLHRSMKCILLPWNDKIIESHKLANVCEMNANYFYMFLICYASQYDLAEICQNDLLYDCSKYT
ncbi:Protein of unknown function [Gryllus bimaculatus]|nr:Protein of unknown function [Gryllus bimaculatus]